MSANSSRTKRIYRSIAILILSVAALGACTNSKPITVSKRRAKIVIPKTLSELSYNWPQVGNNLWGDRYSPIKTFTSSNLSNLTLKFSYNLNHFRVGGQECEPIEMGNYLYVTTSGDGLYAFNAATGSLI